MRLRAETSGNERYARTSDERVMSMAHRKLRSTFNWEMLLGLAATAFIIYVWVWAATQGGPPW